MSSGKERIKKYSERQRENEEKYAMVKNKDSERKNRLFTDESISQPEVLRAKPRKGKRKENKGEIKQIMKKATKSTSKVSPQAFGKALSRAK